MSDSAGSGKVYDFFGGSEEARLAIEAKLSGTERTGDPTEEHILDCLGLVKAERRGDITREEYSSYLQHIRAEAREKGLSEQDMMRAGNEAMRRLKEEQSTTEQSWAAVLPLHQPNQNEKLY